LEVDGKVNIPQSGAILRYVAKIANLTPKGVAATAAAPLTFPAIFHHSLDISISSASNDIETTCGSVREHRAAIEFELSFWSGLGVANNCDLPQILLRQRYATRFLSCRKS
jgi:hypothetical protein